MVLRTVPSVGETNQAKDSLGAAVRCRTQRPDYSDLWEESHRSLRKKSHLKSALKNGPGLKDILSLVEYRI